MELEGRKCAEMISEQVVGIRIDVKVVALERYMPSKISVRVITMLLV